MLSALAQDVCLVLGSSIVLQACDSPSYVCTFVDRVAVLFVFADQVAALRGGVGSIV